MFTIRKQFKFEMAHQLIDSYTTGCQNIHGHSYVLEVYFKSNQLDNTGMIVDFGKVSDLFKKYIDDTWDHMFVVSDKMPEEYISMIKKYNCRVTVINYNPTAELMSCNILHTLNDILMNNNISDITVSKVRLHETTTGWAEYEQ